jgi:hypothetical protein
MTFRKYVGGLQLDADNGHTTLISAVQADVDMPDANEWMHLETYLLTRYASDQALDQVHGFWLDYQTTLKTQVVLPYD